MNQVVLPDAGCALRYGGEQNEATRFMQNLMQNPVHDPDTFEATKKHFVDELADEIQALELGWSLSSQRSLCVDGSSKAVHDAR